jgi:octaheme c-type cytochrome (tetrathionate reductase family)
MKSFLLAAGAVLLLLLAVTTLPRKSHEPSPLADLRTRYAAKLKPSADHRRFAVLRQTFRRPQEVTAACVTCHAERQAEVMRSSHWNWERLEYIPGKGIRSVGKKNILNNFCIGIAGNEQSCNKCHIGYGWADSSFDFSDARNVDCLACHDNSGKYLKAAGGAGYPAQTVDLAAVAQQVGLPQRTNCGTCHFFGGGGNNVKHGDLEQALFDPSRDVDVHMAVDGADMSCVDCHSATRHQMKGKVYSLSSMNRDRATCEQCHTALPHRDDVLNEHTLKVACQTCHIPRYAKVNPTKLRWDWSTAGKLKNGEPYEEKDSTGADTYLSIKGSFVWGRNLVPEYAWFNGTASHALLGDTLPAAPPFRLNALQGSYPDPEAKIIPVKVHRARQIYDTRYRYLIQPKTVSTKAGDGGYWKEFNWQRAAEEGMKRVHLPFSGAYGFAETEMTWPVNHMVAPAAQAVPCAECHTRNGSRLAGLRDFYLPGRDADPTIESLGTGLIALTLAGVGAHAGLRVVLASRRRRKGQEAA